MATLNRKTFKKGGSGRPAGRSLGAETRLLCCTRKFFESKPPPIISNIQEQTFPRVGLAHACSAAAFHRPKHFDRAQSPPDQMATEREIPLPRQGRRPLPKPTACFLPVIYRRGHTKRAPAAVWISKSSGGALRREPALPPLPPTCRHDDALADRHRAALFIGPPQGRNHFYEIFLFAKDKPNGAVFPFTTAPGSVIDADELQDAPTDLESHRQEFVGE